MIEFPEYLVGIYLKSKDGRASQTKTYESVIRASSPDKAAELCVMEAVSAGEHLPNSNYLIKAHSLCVEGLTFYYEVFIGLR